ncbi:hypothetical protein [Pseudomonas sp. UMAB-08]|uniref:hypothetical protein n=1 Tax=Pseudomonas sp. UMAB-08 TaxID=1365375 RepID=UPI001C5A380E|nr:hypothetical protein [Pseudomonas sp. UMAB-08]
MASFPVLPNQGSQCFSAVDSCIESLCKVMPDSLNNGIKDAGEHARTEPFREISVFFTEIQAY